MRINICYQTAVKLRDLGVKPTEYAQTGQVYFMRVFPVYGIQPFVCVGDLLIHVNGCPQYMIKTTTPGLNLYAENRIPFDSPISPAEIVFAPDPEFLIKFAKTCGISLAIDHNDGVFSCTSSLGERTIESINDFLGEAVAESIIRIKGVFEKTA